LKRLDLKQVGWDLDGFFEIAVIRRSERPLDLGQIGHLEIRCSEFKTDINAVDIGKLRTVSLLVHETCAKSVTS
jgi:hypothetical protein